jgi:tRNA nucleotidyltransferase (CCA-adding enzyme)
MPQPSELQSPSAGKPPIAIDSLLPSIPADAVRVCARLRQAGHRGWLVGGCVRDLLLGKRAVDWDIATDAVPEQVVALFRRVVPTGIKHGTVTVLLDGRGYEVTTLRGETTYSDGRHPDLVTFTDDILQDLGRRDFTINAMAIDPLAAELIDPYGGREDLDARVLRAVGDPAVRFTEDGLRPLRAARFSATLECRIEPSTLAAIERALPTYRRVSAERIRDEWLKSMSAARPSQAFEVMRYGGMLAITAPALVEMVGCDQNSHHAYDVWEHTMACVDVCARDPILRVAALLHDIGKPRTRARSQKTGEYTFHGHEVVGAEMARELLERLRFANEERDRVSALVAQHLLLYSDDWTDTAVRRFVRRVSIDRLQDLFALGRADALAKGKEPDRSLSAIDRLEARVAVVLQAKDALAVGDLAVDGHDVMRELGVGPSRRVREVLDLLLERVTEDPKLNERETLLGIMRTIGR